MYTLYYMPGACSMAVHVLLNELRQEVTLENVAVKEDEVRPAKFLTANPRGSVPVLEDDGFVIREGAAILLYLLEKHKSALMPQELKAKATALEWLMFCNATLHPAYSRLFGSMRMQPSEAQEALLNLATENANRLWQDVERRLEQSPYLAGNELTMADILLTVIANWSVKMPKPILLGAKTKALFAKIIARPSYQNALATEQVEYKVAA